MRFLFVAVLVSALGLAACGDDDLKSQIVGKWEMSDPGGAFLSGTVEFHGSGWVTVVERLRDGGQNMLSGTYSFSDSRTVRMKLRQAGGEPQSRDVGVGIRDGWLTLRFGRGQIVYRRADERGRGRSGHAG